MQCRRLVGHLTGAARPCRALTAARPACEGLDAGRSCCSESWLGLQPGQPVGLQAGGVPLLALGLLIRCRPRRQGPRRCVFDSRKSGVIQILWQ